jgi:acylphosphatase
VDTRHFKIRVSGRVQGVFFRASAKEKADELNVKGFVRNEPGGEVYIEAEAAEGIVYKFIRWCNTGPSRARVDNIDVVPGEVIGFVSFEIRR